MKKVFGTLVAAALVAAMFVSCASTEKKSAKKQQKESKYEYDMEDYPGAARGNDCPEWLIACDDQDYETLEAEVGDKLEGKYYIICSYTQDTKDMSAKVQRMAEEHCQSDMARQVARTLANHVQVTSGESISQDDMQTLTSQASDVNISGFKRMYNGYMLITRTEKATGKEKRYYKVFQIYAIDEDMWNEIQTAYYQKLGLVKNLPEDVQKAVNRADEMLKNGQGIQSGFSQDAIESYED